MHYQETITSCVRQLLLCSHIKETKTHNYSVHVRVYKTLLNFNKLHFHFSYRFLRIFGKPLPREEGLQRHNIHLTATIMGLNVIRKIGACNSQ